MQQNMKCHQWLYDCIHQLQLFLAISGGMHSMTYHFIFWQQQWSLTKSWYGVETILPFWHCRDPWWRDQSPGCCKWKSLLLSPPAQRPGEFFYIVHNLWEECRLICAMTTLMSISTRSSALHIWDLPNKETYQQQPNKGKSYHQDTNKQRKNLPSRKRIQKMPFLHSTSCLPFWNMWTQIKNNLIMIIMGTGQASDRPDEGFDWRSWMGGGYNVGCWMDEKLRQVEDLVWMRLKSWMMVTLSLWSRRCEWASSRTGPSMWSLTPLRSTGQSHSRGRGLEGFWLFFKS